MSQAQMIDPATVYEEGHRVSEENAKLRSLLREAAKTDRDRMTAMLDGQKETYG